MLPVLGVLAVCAFVGCGASKPKLCPISGTVTLDGKPLDAGLIYFKTIESGAIHNFQIEGGAFAGETDAGERRVEIYCYVAKKQEVNLNGMKGELQENIIPPRYNLESKLTATVTREGPNQFKFELTKK